MPLQDLTDAIAADPGLMASITEDQIQLGLDASAELSRVLLEMIRATRVNRDGLISPEDMQAVSDALWRDENAQPWREFWLAHGNDSGDVTSGFHWVQNDGATMLFRGRNFVDTVADGIYHYGFRIEDGRYANEDGNDNERIVDVAGWLNYFLNGRSVVWGSDAADSLGSGDYDAHFADARNESFYGGGGHDRIWASTGNDRVFGGWGNDQSGGGTGRDHLWGEFGNDTLWGEEGADTLSGGAGDDVLGGGSEDDALDGNDGNDTLSGETGNDSLTGGDGNDGLYGGDGRDRLSGEAGNDRLSGGEAADRLSGGLGRDTLSGGEGADHLDGGAGADLFQMWEAVEARDTLQFGPGDSGRAAGEIDTVEGFQRGVDVIDLTAFGAMTLESLDFTEGGLASCYYDGRHLRIDADGDRAVDMMVAFSWIGELTASDFLFAA